MTAELLDLWKILCILHIINLIFQEFKKSIAAKITPIFNVIKYAISSEHHEICIEQKIKDGLKIRKIPFYVESRWTSFCEWIIVLVLGGDGAASSLKTAFKKSMNFAYAYQMLHLKHLFKSEKTRALLHLLMIDPD